MDLSLTAEQQMLQDETAKLLTRLGGADRARALRDSESGFDRAVFRQIASEGWVSALVPEAEGGLALGLAELALLLEQTGRALAPEPIGAAAVAAAALASCPATDITRALLADALSGEAIVLPAGDFDAEIEAAEADGDQNRVRLSGKCETVFAAIGADHFILPARRGGTTVLCSVSTREPGLAVEPMPTVDGGTHGRLAFKNDCSGAVLADGQTAVEIVRQMHDRLLFTVSAELLGIMAAAFDITLEYLKTRKQFGKLIGSFPVLQHRAVDDFTQIVGTRALLFQIAGTGSDVPPTMAAALKAQASAAGLRITKSAIQMHGAIGFTDEHDIGLYLKRAMRLSASLGNAAACRARYTALTDRDNR